MKATAIAPSNIAFTKYWGKKPWVGSDAENPRLPENGSVSMCLSNLRTRTTVEFSSSISGDEITINGLQEEGESGRVVKHLNRIRKMAGSSLFARVVSENNFPTGTGLSSSASGFAALSVAAAKAIGLSLSERELSVLARKGSGSACRSIPGGFVEWRDAEISDDSFAETIFPASHWAIADVVAVVSEAKKEVSTSQGQESATSSPFLAVRLSRMSEKNKAVKKLISEKRFPEFGEFVEAEALELHCIMLTQTPPLIYLRPNSLLLIRLCRQWRAEGLLVYFTVNTGQDVHLICEKQNVELLTKKLRELPEVKNIMVNYPSEGTQLVSEHLF